MKLGRDEVLEVIAEAVLGLNDFRTDSDQLSFSESLVLFGPVSTIDSLDLVSVITEVEEALSDRYDVTIYLTDDRALAHTPSPFDSVGNLADYIILTLQERGDAL